MPKFNKHKKNLIGKWFRSLPEKCFKIDGDKIICTTCDKEVKFKYSGLRKPTFKFFTYFYFRFLAIKNFSCSSILLLHFTEDQKHQMTTTTKMHIILATHPATCPTVPTMNLKAIYVKPWLREIYRGMCLAMLHLIIF